jgi:excisionase family DNA binding protein
MTQPTLQDISEQLSRVERFAAIGAKTVLDIDETALFTGLRKGNIYNLSSNRQIPHYKRGNKLYFKKSELEDWMLHDRVMTAAEIDSRAATYVTIHKQH